MQVNGLNGSQTDGSNSGFIIKTTSENHSDLSYY